MATNCKMKFLRTLFFLLLALPAYSAHVTISITLTNPPLTGNDFTRNGVLVKWTNAPLNTTAFISTNASIPGAGTNLARHLAANMLAWYVTQTNATNITISGTDAQFSIGTVRYAILTTNISGSTSNGWFVRVPLSTSYDATNQTNTANEILRGIKTYGSDLDWLLAMSNRVYKSVFLNGGTLSNSVAQGVSGYFTNAAIDKAFLTNATIVSGTLTGTVMNLSGSGAGVWMTIESSSTTAALGPTIGFYRSDGAGSFAETEDLAMGLVALGYGDTGYQPLARIKAYAQTNIADANSPGRLEFAVTPVGASATATRMTIDGDKVVVTNAPFSAAMGITNQVFRGTNVINGRVDFTSRANTSLVNGANAGIILGTNVYVRLSGATTIAGISGFAAEQDGSFHILQFSGAITNVIVNEANSTDIATDGTAANRIVTGTGTNFYATNSPLVIPVVYDATAARWRIMNFLR